MKEKYKFICITIIICILIICLSIIFITNNGSEIRLIANEEFRDAIKDLEIKQTTIYADEIWIHNDGNNTTIDIFKNKEVR